DRTGGRACEAAAWLPFGLQRWDHQARAGFGRTQEKEAEMTIAAILQGRGDNSIISVAPEMPVKDVLALLADKRIGAVPVIEHEQVIGIMSERDMIYGLRREGPDFLDQPVRRAMTSPV